MDLPEVLLHLLAQITGGFHGQQWVDRRHAGRPALLEIVGIGAGLEADHDPVDLTRFTEKFLERLQRQVGRLLLGGKHGRLVDDADDLQF